MRKRISPILRGQLDDLNDLYQDAKLNENGSLMEKLSKGMSDMARKIKDQETHEKETVSRHEFLFLIGAVGTKVGEILLSRIDDDVLCTQIIDEISDAIAELAERTFTQDE